MREDYQALRVSEIYYLTLEDKKEGRKEREGGERRKRQGEREAKGDMHVHIHALKTLEPFLVYNS